MLTTHYVQFRNYPNNNGSHIALTILPHQVRLGNVIEVIDVWIVPVRRPRPLDVYVGPRPVQYARVMMFTGMRAEDRSRVAFTVVRNGEETKNVG